MTQLKFTKDEYINADCMQFEIPRLGFALYFFTSGKMCAECPKYQGGTCDSLLEMMIARTPIESVFATPLVETVREEATRRNIGIKEVRRQRNTARLGE